MTKEEFLKLLQEKVDNYKNYQAKAEKEECPATLSPFSREVSDANLERLIQSVDAKVLEVVGTFYVDETMFVLLENPNYQTEDGYLDRYLTSANLDWKVYAIRKDLALVETKRVPVISPSSQGITYLVSGVLEMGDYHNKKLREVLDVY